MRESICSRLSILRYIWRRQRPRFYEGTAATSGRSLGVLRQNFLEATETKPTISEIFSFFCRAPTQNTAIMRFVPCAFGFRFSQREKAGAAVKGDNSRSHCRNPERHVIFLRPQEARASTGTRGIILLLVVSTFDWRQKARHSIGARLNRHKHTASWVKAREEARVGTNLARNWSNHSSVKVGEIDPTAVITQSNRAPVVSVCPSGVARGRARCCVDYWIALHEICLSFRSTQTF